MKSINIDALSDENKIIIEEVYNWMIEDKSIVFIRCDKKKSPCLSGTLEQIKCEVQSFNANHIEMMGMISFALHVVQSSCGG